MATTVSWLSAGRRSRLSVGKAIRGCLRRPWRALRLTRRRLKRTLRALRKGAPDALQGRDASAHGCTPRSLTRVGHGAVSPDTIALNSLTHRESVMQPTSGLEFTSGHNATFYIDWQPDIADAAALGMPSGTLQPWRRRLQ